MSKFIGVKSKIKEDNIQMVYKMWHNIVSVKQIDIILSSKLERERERGGGRKVTENEE